MRPARVLLVDDLDRTLSSALADALGEHEVETANDAFDAIYRIDCADDPPDAIVCDLSRGDMPGPELWSYLSLTRRQAADRMVFVASGPLTNEARTFLRCVPNPCIELPTTASAMAALVCRGAVA
jgi:DNA-binding NarL/FixJ family response regulator